MDPNMEHIEIIKMLINLGPVTVILVLGYLGKLQIDKTLSQYREDMLEQRKMYESNVELVKRYQNLAGDLKDVITLNTRVMTQLVDRIEKEVNK